MRLRRGTTLLECGVAAVIVAMLMGIAMQFFAAVGKQRQAQRCRAAALDDASAALERLAIEPWESLTAAALEKTPWTGPAEGLPDGRREVAVEPAGSPESKQLTVTVHWAPHRGQAESLRLVAWRSRLP